MQWRMETDLPSAVDIPTVKAEMVQRGIQQFKPMILQRGSPAICKKAAVPFQKRLLSTCRKSGKAAALGERLHGKIRLYGEFSHAA